MEGEIGGEVLYRDQRLSLSVSVFEAIKSKLVKPWNIKEVACELLMQVFGKKWWKVDGEVGNLAFGMMYVVWKFRCLLFEGDVVGPAGGWTAFL